MLESIYSPVTKEQSPLAAFLASQTRKKGTFNDGQQQPGMPGATPLGGPTVGPGGTFNDGQQQPGAPGATVPGNALGGSAGPAAAAEQAKTGGAGPDLPGLNFDYQSDPALQRILSGNVADEADAETSATAARRSLLSQYGDQGLASTVLGAGDPTVGAISDDPNQSTSILARLRRGYDSTVKQNEDSMNENNLFYSGFRGKRLGDLARDNETQRADASSQVHAALDQIGAGLASSKRGLRDKASAAQADAANRKAQEVLAGILAGGGAGDGATDPTNGPAAGIGADPSAWQAAEPSFVTGSGGFEPGAAAWTPEEIAKLKAAGAYSGLPRLV